MAAKRHKGHKPRWKVAMISSLVMPGLGQLYAGSLRWALGWVLVLCVAVWGVVWVWLSRGISASAARITAAILPGIWLLIALHAAWLGRRGRRLALPRWLRVICYIGFAVAIGAIGLAQQYWVRSHWIRPLTITGEAMAPNLLPDDRVLVDLSAYRGRDPLRGEVVVFDIAMDEDGFHPVDVRPHAPRTTLIQRVVGLPGDRIAVRHGVLYINQRPVNTLSTGRIYTDRDDCRLDIRHQVINSKIVSLVIDPEIDHRGLSRPALKQIRETPAQTVPADRYFVLGDNRSYAIDSRYWGTVCRQDILGPAVRIYYPGQANAAASRPGRIGQVIE